MSELIVVSFFDSPLVTTWAEQALTTENFVLNQEQPIRQIEPSPYRGG